MKIKQKLFLGYVVIILLMLSGGYIIINKSRESLEAEIGKRYTDKAIEILQEIDIHIFNRIELFRAYTKDEYLQSYLIQENQKFEVLDNRPDYIKNIEKKWISGDKQINSFISDLTNNPLSKKFKEKIDFYFTKYGYRLFGELFLTNKYGTNIAQTRKTSDYFQGDEAWWQVAKEKGSYIGDVVYDESARLYSIDIALSVIDKEGDFLGVLKVVLNIREIIKIIKKEEKASVFKSTDFKLLTAEGRIIYATEKIDLLENVLSKYKFVFSEEEGYCVAAGDKSNEGEEIFVHAHSRGYSDYKGLGWVLVVEHEVSEIFYGINRLKDYFLVVIMFLFLTAVLLSLIIAYSFSAPIEKLKNAALDIGKGKLNKRIYINANDEINQLANSFNKMLDDLNESTVSRELLLREIDERKQAEREIIKFKTISDNARYGNAILDFDDQIIYVNRAMAKMHGYEISELINKKISIFYSDSLASYESLKEKNSFVNKEVWHKRKDGSIFPALMSVTVINADDERHAVISVTVIDITERKKEEEERSKLEKNLLQAHKMESIGTLAAGIAHEINTPIQFINDNNEFINTSVSDLFVYIKKLKQLLIDHEEGKKLEDIDTQLNMLEEEVDFKFIEKEIPLAFKNSKEGLERVTSIVKSMRDFSHTTIAQEKVPADINEAIRTAITISRNEWKYVAQIETHFDLNLSPVKCFVGDLKQVILNLIINAVHSIAEKIGKEGNEMGRIDITTKKEDSHVLISVSDTGMGISEDIKEKVFDYFFTTKGVGKGTGQGLALAYSSIVEKHNGEIWFESEIGKGTTFFIRI